MNKVLLIISREYITRVRKKSFLIMTFVGPLLIAILYGLSIWLVISDLETDEIKKVMVIDESGLFSSKLENNKSIEFEFTDIKIDQAKLLFLNADYYGLLHIPELDINDPKAIKLHGKTQSSFTVQNYIEKSIQKEIERIKMEKAGIEKELIDKIKTRINVETLKLTDEGEEVSSTGIAIGIGMMGAVLIYIFIFMYGVQVMRGVIEEKTSRIVEIIISSVRPFQLMMGKIIGVAAVGLTQFFLWVILVIIITSIINAVILPELTSGTDVLKNMNTDQPQTAQMAQISKMMESLGNINYFNILGCFIFFFMGGYLLYSSLFAAIGSAVDSEADTQQFILPITAPLILAFILAQNVIKNPDSSMAFWLSIIPLTSPVIMMVRIPFGVPGLELALAMILLVVGFLLTTYIAARIYRIGILMYGKKATFKELGKWIFYK
ncbi:ABC transporter permease [Candidatus Amoebophilus asiaticus]|nr:ABC transporter permease [Candidatus Amoebophilus asiaticus]